MNLVGGKIDGNGNQHAAKQKAQRAFFHGRKRALNLRTAHSRRSGAPRPPAETARKSAPASISAGALAMVMPPMATQGTTITSLHQRSSSTSAWVLGSLVWVAKKAPKAT